MVKLNLDFSNPKVAIVNIVIILVIVFGALEGYKKGLFERVLVCIKDYSVSKELRQFLQENSVPELCLGHPDDPYLFTMN